MKALHFGAGKVGRGIVTLHLIDSDYSVIFVDVNEDLIDELNQEGYYNVIDSEGKLTVINGIRAIDSYTHQDQLDVQFLFTDLITTSISLNVLAHIAVDIVEAFNAIPHAMCRVIASVLMCDQERLKFMINDLGVEKTLQELTGIEDYTILFEEMIKSYERIQKSTD